MKFQRGLNGKILSLAIPAIVSNITVPLLGLSDTAIAGHIGSDLYLAAIAVGATMMNLSSWLFGFLRMGTTGLSANLFGGNDARGLSRLFCKTLISGIFIGLLLFLFRHRLAVLLTGLLNPGPEISAAAISYYEICIAAAPAQLATMAMSGWMVGMQSTFWPMVVAITTNALNIPLSLLFVFATGRGFPGLATGTAAAQWVGFALSLWFCIRLWRRYAKINPEAKGHSVFWAIRDSIRGKGNASFLTTNSSLLIRSGCVMAVSMGMTYFAGRLGEAALGANAVMIQFFTFFSFFMDGFAHASEAMVGSAKGNGNGRMLRTYVKAILAWSAGMAILFFLIYLWAGRLIVSLLTDSPSVRDIVGKMNWILCLIPPVSVMAFIFDGFYVGLTKTVPMMWTTILSTALFFIIIGVSGGMDCFPTGIFGREFNQTLLWISFLTYLFSRGVILGAAFPHMMKKSL